MHLATDHIHPYEDAGDVLRTAAYGSTCPTRLATLQW